MGLLARPSLAAPRVSTLRGLHASTSTPFLASWLPSRDSSKKTLQALRSSLQKHDVQGFLQQYTSLLQHQKSKGPSVSSDAQNQETLSHKDGQAALRLLATARKRLTGRDLRRLRRVFGELETWFGVHHPIQNHHWLLLGMVKAGKPLDALRWIQSMQHAHNISPGVQDWNVVLSGFVPSGSRRKKNRPANFSFDAFEQAWSHLLNSGTQPDIISFNIHLRGLFALNTVEQDRINECLQDMQRRKVKPTTNTWTILLEGYTSLDDPQRAEDALHELKASKSLDTVAWNTILASVGHLHGSSAVWQQWAEWQASSAPPEADEFTFAHFVRWSTRDVFKSDDPVQAAIEELESASSRCAIRPNPWGCATYIQRLLDGASDPAQGYQLAYSLYQKLIFGPDAVLPHSAMINPLLERLVQLQDLPDRLSQAQRLFDTLSEGVDEGYAPDVGVCHSILRICEQAGPAGVEYALAVLDHMREDHLVFDKQETVLEHLKGLMQAAGSYQLAFKAYSWIRAVDPTVLDRVAYNRILTVFSFLQFTPAGPTSSTSATTSKISPQFFLEILKDMRKSGHSPDTVTYTLLLEYYSRHYQRADQIRRLHDIIKVDLQYDPDIRLHNALIVAYGYVRDYPSAIRVWQNLLANRHRPNMAINHATISAVIDVCGFSGRRQLADQVWKSIQNDRYIQPNKRNWDTLVECICRLGSLDDACDIALGEEMAHLVDSDTVDILMKFSRRAEGERPQQTAERIRGARPDLL